MKTKMILGTVFILLLAVSSFAQPKGDFPGDRPKMNPDEMAEKIADRLKKDLNLTDSQYNSVYEVYKNHFSEMKNIMENFSKNEDDMQKIMDQKQSELKTGMSGILNDKKIKKWEEIHKEVGQRQGPPGNRQGPPPRDR